MQYGVRKGAVWGNDAHGLRKCTLWAEKWYAMGYRMAHGLRKGTLWATEGTLWANYGKWAK